MKSKINTGNILYTLITILLLAVIINRTAKSYLIRGLMDIGFFKPEIPAEATKTALAAPFNVSFTDTSGKTVSLTDLKGKVLFVNFWATWCPPCIAEMPDINTLHEQFKHNPNVIFIMVDVDNDYTKAHSFMQKHQYHLPIYTLASTIPKTVMNGTIPTTLVFNKNGNLVFRKVNAADYSSSRFQNYLTGLSKAP